MPNTTKKAHVPDIADIERAAWFARMAVGAPLARVGEAPKTTTQNLMGARTGH